MSFFHKKPRECFRIGRYYCNECGESMEFEYESMDILVCLKCGHSVELDHYGSENDSSYESLYPTEEEVLAKEQRKRWIIAKTTAKA